MLTNRQMLLWRIHNTSQRRVDQRKFQAAQFNSILNAQASDSSVSSGSSEDGESTTSSKQKKKVHFNNTVRLVLIPDRNEYSEAGLIDVLWYTNDEYKIIKTKVRTDVRNYFTAHSLFSPVKKDEKEAINALYYHSDDHETDDHKTNGIEL